MQSADIHPASASFTVPSVRMGQNLRFMESAIEMIVGHPVFVAPRSNEPRYLLTTAVCDYVRLGEKDPSIQILSALQNEHREDVRQGRALLVLDLSNEGPPFDFDLFDSLHLQLDEAKLPRSNVIFVSQNRRLEADYRHSFGAGGLRFWALDFFPISIVNLFDQRRGNLSLEGYSPVGGAKDKLYNCFNSAPRWHRVILYRWLQEQGYLPKGLVSFHGTSAVNPKGAEIDIDHPPALVTNAFPSLTQNLRSFLPSEPLRIDDSATFGNALSTSIPVDAYARTNLSVVTESDFFDAQTERVTEKSIKAAAMGLPFIIAGPKKSISLLRDLGFRTFDNLIDHSYDEMEDVERMKAIMRAAKHCIDRMNTDLAEWQQAAREDALFNYQHARQGLADRFRQIVIAPVTDQIRNFIQGA